MVAQAAAAQGGQLELTDPVYSNADQRVLTSETIVVNVGLVVWVARWVDFQAAHRVVDEAARS